MSAHFYDYARRFTPPLHCENPGALARRDDAGEEACPRGGGGWGEGRSTVQSSCGVL